MEAALGPGEATLTSTVTAHRFYLARGWSDAGDDRALTPGMIAVSDAEACFRRFCGQPLPASR